MIEVIRCSNCQADLVEDLAPDKWLRLVHLLEFLRTECYIEMETYTAAMGDLMHLKPIFKEK